MLKKMLRFNFFFVFMLSCTAFSQAHIELPLISRDSNGETDTIYFGLHPLATPCVDNALGEFEIPPMIFCTLSEGILFVDPATSTAPCLGEGVTKNLLPSYSTTQRDTFRVAFCGQYPITFRWSNEMQTHFDSAFIRYRIHGENIIINMMAQDSLVIDSSAVDKFSLYTYAPHTPNGLSPSFGEVPDEIFLHQNYPNPFNPVTVIPYEVQNGGRVQLKIYDILGKEVATLFDGYQHAGIYEQVWSAPGVASGVYYYRLVSGSFSATRKLLIMR